MDLHETALPGIGVRHEFTTDQGRRVGLVSHRSGRREVVFYDERDPDAVSQSVSLTADESEAVATLLGAARITRELVELPQQVEGLLVEWLRVPPGSPYAGRTLGDLGAAARAAGRRLRAAPGGQRPLHRALRRARLRPLTRQREPGS